MRRTLAVYPLEHYIQQGMQERDWSVSVAAKFLGVSEEVLLRLLAGAEVARGACQLAMALARAFGGEYGFWLCRMGENGAYGQALRREAEDALHAQRLDECIGCPALGECGVGEDRGSHNCRLSAERAHRGPRGNYAGWIRWEGAAGEEGCETEEDEALGLRRQRRSRGSWKYWRIGSPQKYTSQDALQRAVRELGCGETPVAAPREEWDGVLRWVEEDSCGEGQGRGVLL